MIGYIIGKAAEILLDLVTKLLTEPLGWIVLAAFVGLHITGIYTFDQFVADASLVLWETTLQPLIDWIVSTIEQFIQDTLNPL